MMDKLAVCRQDSFVAQVESIGHVQRGAQLLDQHSLDSVVAMLKGIIH